MKNVKHFLNKFKYVFAAIFAIVLSFTCVLATKGQAKTTYTVNGNSFSKEAFGETLPTKTGSYYLTKDFNLEDDYVVASGTIKLYLNGYNINLNGHQIKLTGGSLYFYEDRDNPTFYRLDSNGKVVGGNDHVVNGGLITGATTDYAVLVNGSSANLYLYGANIFGNNSGALKINSGSCTMTGGAISGNYAASGAGVNLASSSASLTMTGGVIEYNTASSHGAGVYQNGRIVVSKSATISNNKLTSGVKNNVDVITTNSTNSKIIVSSGALTGYIGITSSSTTKLTSSYGYYNNASTDIAGEHFFSDLDDKYITSDGTGNSQEAIFTSTEPEHIHNSEAYTKWESKTSLPTTAGKYYLANDIILSSRYDVSGEIDICLNGHSIDLNSYYINLLNSSTLTIRDCNKEIHHYDINSNGLASIGGTKNKFVGGYIFGAYAYRAINMTISNATFNMYGGAILGNEAGAIKIARPSTGSAKINLSNCYIVGNTTKHASEKKGSAIYAGDHEGISLINTVIKHNKSYLDDPSEKGGAIWTAGAVSTSAKIKVRYGVIITDNIDSNGKQCNVYIDRVKGHTIEVADVLHKSGYTTAKIGVTTTYNLYSTSDSIQITSKFHEHEALYEPSSYFFSDEESFTVFKKEIYNSLTGATEVEGALKVEHKHSSTSCNPMSTLSLTATSQTERYFMLTKDIKLESDWTVPTGARINICMAGHTIDLNGHSIIVPTSSNLKIIDDSSYTNKYYINSSGIAVVDNDLGTNRFNHAYIYDSKVVSTSSATTSFFKLTGGTLELDGVNIFGAYTNGSTKADVNAAVDVASGTFTMSNGIVAGCKGKYGSAVHVYDSTFPSNPTKANASLSNVKLLNNTASSGGAIYVYYGQLTLADSYVLNNKATSEGGAIDLNIGSSGTISYSYFYNNEAKYSGGAINSYSGKDSKITNSEFAYNKAGTDGGAIYCQSYMDLSYVTFVANEAASTGGAMKYGGSGCYLKLMDYVLISNNKAGSYGGGLYIKSLIDLKGEIIIENNTANGETSNATFKTDTSVSLGQKMYFSGALTGSSKIGINILEQGTGNKIVEGAFTSYYTERHSSTDINTYFFSDVEDGVIELRDSEGYFVPPHYHTITYTTSNNKLTAKCSECGETIATLTVNSATATYDKSTHNVTSNIDEFAEILGITPTVNIYYYPANSTIYSTTAPKDAGSYTVNYNVTIGSQTYYLKSSITINKRVITVSGMTCQTKDYDGTTRAMISATYTISNAASGDSLSLNITADFENKNAGFNKTVNITNIAIIGSAYTKNYTVDLTNSQKTTTGIILAKSITVSGISAYNKAYDGTTAANLSYSSVTFGGIISGDSLTVSGTGTFADKNVGSNITVNISNLVLDGADKSNYSINKNNSQKTTLATISKKTITVSGIIAANKVYDGTTDLDIRYDYVKFDGKADGDALSVTAVAKLNDPKYSPEAVIVNITSLTLTGTSASNYTLDTANSQKTISVGMQTRVITVTGIVANDKVYDGTSTATFDCSNVTINNLVEGDVVIISAEGSFSDVNAGNNITVNITNLFASGADLNNYQLSVKASQKQATANITPKEVTVSGIKANNKEYDGTTSATFNCANAILTPYYNNDVVVVEATGSFADANYGTNKVVNILTITLSGANANNYVVAATGNQETSTADITKKIMNITVTSFEGSYDKNPHTISISGFPKGTVTKYSENGIDYTTDRPQYVYAGTYTVYYTLNCNNYEEVTGSVDVVINRAKLTISGVEAISKVYDGNTSLSFNYTSLMIFGRCKGDELSVTATGAFVSVNVGTNIDVAVEYILGGNSKDNYYIENVEDTLKADIVKAGITISNIKVKNKYYDGNAIAEADVSQVIYSGIIPGDELSLTLNANFENAMYGENKVVYLTNLMLVGEKAGNYYISDMSQSEATATIFKKLMTCTVEDFDGTYDGLTHTISITNALSGVTITYSATENGEFTSETISYKNAGIFEVYYKVEKEDYETISGVAYVTINRKEVTVSNIKVNDKVYDGNTDATLDFSNAILDGVISGETLTASAKGQFDTKNAGSNKNVAITNIKLSDEANYVVSSDSQATAAASISAKKLVITSVTILDKTYDKTTDAEIGNVVIEGVVDGDKVSITANASFVDGETGSDKKVVITDINLDGDDKINYEIEIDQIESSANIVKAKSKGLNGGAIAGIIIASLAVSGAIGFSLYWFVFRKKKA